MSKDDLRGFVNVLDRKMYNGLRQFFVDIHKVGDYADIEYAGISGQEGGRIRPCMLCGEVVKVLDDCVVLLFANKEHCLPYHAIHKVTSRTRHTS